MRLRGLTPETVGLSIGMRRPVIAATKKRRDLAGPPLDLIDSLSEPQGLVAATAEETESTQRTKKGSGGLRHKVDGRTRTSHRRHFRVAGT